MNSIIKKIAAICLCALLIAGAFPLAAFADDAQKVTLNAAFNTSINRGGTAYITVKSKSSTADPYKLIMKSQTMDITVKDGNSGVITSTDEKSTIYEISASQNASIMQQKLTVQAVSAADEKLLQEYEVVVTVIDNSNDYQIGRAETNLSYTLSGGDAIYAGDINSLTIVFYNRGNSTIKNAEIMLSELPAGISVHSGAAAQFVGNLNPNKTATATFPIVCDKSISEGSYKITAVCRGVDGRYTIDEGTDAFGNPTSSITPNPTSVTITEAFYVPVKNGGKTQSSDVAKPILMVSNYSTGGNIVAGKNFTLSLTLLNTSKVDLSNIKVTLNTNGRFVPVGASNSFYVDSVSAGEKVSKSLTLSSQRDLSQGSYGISVNMEYESNKQSFSASDEISAYIIQEARLVVDDILDPGSLMAGNNGYCTINYRNMGSSAINNLTISIEGDFSIEGNPIYYVGNLMSGKSDSYSFSFTPAQAGECAGKATFTYEDAGGTERSIEKTFTFNVADMPSFDPSTDNMPEMPQQKTMPVWVWLALVVVAVIVVVIIVKSIKNIK